MKRTPAEQNERALVWRVVLSYILAVIILLLSTTAGAATCDWSKPGVDPYRGTTAAALARYADLTPATRGEMLRRIDVGDADGTVLISRDAITGGYGPAITSMHFGHGRVCAAPSRVRWGAGHTEAARVYCVSGQCVIVPIICGNVARVSAPPVVAVIEIEPGGTGGLGGSLPGVVMWTPETADRPCGSLPG